MSRCLITAFLLVCLAAFAQAPVARYSFDAEFGAVEPEATGFGPPASVVRDWPGRRLSRREPGLFGRALRPTERGFVRSTFPADRTFTVSFWIKPERVDAASIFRCGRFFSIGIDRHRPLLSLTLANRRATTPISVGEWICVTLVSDGEQSILCIDGAPVAEIPTGVDGEPRDAEVVFANPGGAHHQFQGLMDEVRIYDRPLDADEIARIADPAHCLDKLPPTVDAGIDHTLYLEAGKASVTVTGLVTGGEAARWETLSSPAEAKVAFVPVTAPATKIVLETPGAYELALVAENPHGAARDAISIAVFPAPTPRRGTPAADERRPGTVGDRTRTPWGKADVYGEDFVKRYFPPREVEYHWDGFARNRFTPPPAAYSHPRIFFGPEDLPAMRRRLRETRAGQAARAAIESRMQIVLGDLSPERPLPPYFRRRQGDEKRDFFDGTAAAIYCATAFFAMIDADTARARQVIEAAISVADNQLAAIAAVPEDKRTDWQGIYHNILGRYATSYVYDFLYPWMTAAEQDKLRAVISGCTTGKWSVGMFAVNGHGTSNWQSWVTGDLLANVLAIEGEDGFDPVVYHEAANALRRFWQNGVLPDGAMFEGMGKNSLTPQNLIALARRGQFDLASSRVYQHLAGFRLHTMQPYGYQFIGDDLWGGSRNGLHVAEAAVAKFAYPNDPVIDFLYRNAVGDDYQWEPRLTTYSYSTDLIACWTAGDWQGDPDWNRNAAAALAAEPLSFFSNGINLVTARTTWQADAAYLYFLPRMLGGHPSPARGTFVFSALGRDWTLYPTGHNDRSSLQHNVITIDGKSAGTQWARMLAYEAQPEAVFAACDVRAAYARRRPEGVSMDDYRLVKNTAPWTGLPLGQLPHWYDGDRMTDPEQQPGHMIPPGRKSEASPGESVRAAYRAAGLVRGPQPYVLIVDDFEVDGAPHLYRWQVVLPPDLAAAAVVNGREALVTDPETGNRLLVRILAAAGDVTGRVETLDKKLEGHTVLAFETTCVAPGFTVLLIALRPDETAPVTAWDGGTLSIGADRIDFTMAADGRRRGVLHRDGREVLRW